MATNNNETKNNNIDDFIMIGKYHENEWFIEDISDEINVPKVLTLNTYEYYCDSAPDIRLLTNTLDDDEEIDDEYSIIDDEDLFLDEDGEVNTKVELASMVTYDLDSVKIFESFNILSKANEMVDLLFECYDELENENLKGKIKELLERPLTIKNEFYATCGNCGKEMLCHKSTLKRNKDKIYYRCICDNPIYTGDK